MHGIDTYGMGWCLINIDYNYWVWKAVLVNRLYQPRVVVIEVNSGV